MPQLKCTIISTNKYTWINISLPQQSIEHLQLAIRAVKHSTLPTRIVLLTDQPPPTTDLDNSIRTHTILTIPPHALQLEKDNLSHNPCTELAKAYIPRLTLPTTLRLILIESPSTPMYNSYQLRNEIYKHFPTPQYKIHPHPTWHPTLTPIEYDKHTTISYPPLPHSYRNQTSWLRLKPERYIDKENKIDELRIPSPTTYTLRALGAGPKGLRSILLKKGHEPDKITPNTIQQIKHIIRDTTYKITNRIYRRELTQKYGAPD